MQVLQAAGKNLTRAGLMKAARNMAFTAKLRNANPFLFRASTFTRRATTSSRSRR